MKSPEIPKMVIDSALCSNDNSACEADGPVGGRARRELFDIATTAGRKILAKGGGTWEKDKRRLLALF